MKAKFDELRARSGALSDVELFRDNDGTFPIHEYVYSQLSDFSGDFYRDTRFDAAGKQLSVTKNQQPVGE